MDNLSAFFTIEETPPGGQMFLCGVRGGRKTTEKLLIMGPKMAVSLDLKGGSQYFPHPKSDAKNRPFSRAFFLGVFSQRL
jgi:hypothetical protein